MESNSLESSNKLHESSTQNPSIMIVDDEPDVLLTYESFLSNAGFNVSTFEEPYKALAEYTSNPRLYDLIILDIRMENLNGLQLYQCMKAINPASKLIFASALDAAKELTSILPDIQSHQLEGLTASRTSGQKCASHKTSCSPFSGYATIRQRCFAQPSSG